jgi:ABC-type sugar transport system, periplasmic component
LGGYHRAQRLRAPAAGPGASRRRQILGGGAGELGAGHNAKVNYEAVAWPQLHDKMATNFASGTHVWDVIYMSGWVPEFLKFVQPFSDKLSPGLVADMPKSSFSTVTWDGKSYGAVFTLSLLTLFYNTEHFEKAGIKEPPRHGTI